MYRANNPNAPGMNTFRPPDYGGEEYTGGSHTRVHYKENSGYFQRLGQSFCGIGIGIVLLFCSFPLLFWNEGRAVQTARSLNEGIAIVIPLKNSINEDPLETNNGKLVHLTGLLKTVIPLSDPDFGVRVHATHLKRHVEMYQWIETEHKREHNEGDRTRVETTYSYHKEWRGDLVRSFDFSNSLAHKNPTTFTISKYTKTAEPVYVGRFQLSPGLKTAVNNYKVLFPKEKPDGWTLLDQHLYRSVDPFKPEVGDLRVSFSYSGLSGHSDMYDLGLPDYVSVVARQNNNMLSPFKTEAGNFLELLYMGSMTAEEIFDAEHTANYYLTWGLRFAGWMLMFIGFQIIMDIFRQLVSFIPIIRDIVGLATSLVAFTFASSLSLLVVAVGWLWYRPLLSVALLVAAIVPLVISRKHAQKDKIEKE